MPDGYYLVPNTFERVEDKIDESPASLNYRRGRAPAAAPAGWVRCSGGGATPSIVPTTWWTDTEAWEDLSIGTAAKLVGGSLQLGSRYLTLRTGDDKTTGNPVYVVLGDADEVVTGGVASWVGGLLNTSAITQILKGPKKWRDKQTVQASDTGASTVTDSGQVILSDGAGSSITIQSYSGIDSMSLDIPSFPGAVSISAAPSGSQITVKGISGGGIVTLQGDASPSGLGRVSISGSAGTGIWFSAYADASIECSFGGPSVTRKLYMPATGIRSDLRYNGIFIADTGFAVVRSVSGVDTLQVGQSAKYDAGTNFIVEGGLIVGTYASPPTSPISSPPSPPTPP